MLCVSCFLGGWVERSQSKISRGTQPRGFYIHFLSGISYADCIAMGELPAEERGNWSHRARVFRVI